VNGTRHTVSCLCAALALWAGAASAQVGVLAATTPAAGTLSTLWSAQPGNNPSAAANSLTIQINSGATQSILSIVDNRINTFPTAVNITTTWNLAVILSAIDLVGYFTAPSAALVSGANTLPSSRILGRMLTGRATSFSAFTQNPVGGIGTPGGSLHLYRQFILPPFNTTGSRTDNLDLQLDLRGIPNLPVGTYAGTLNLRAIAY